MKRAKATSADKLIEQIYYRNCSGIQINVMDIGKVFDAGKKAITDNPAITQDELTDVIRQYVETIRKN